MPKAKIRYLGHSTVSILTETNKTIVIDPWLDGNPRCPVSVDELGKVDAICLTHGHADHTGSVVQLAKKSQAPIFATYELAMLLGKIEGVSESQLQPMNKGGTVEIPGGEGISVSLTNAYHSSSYDASDGNTYYAGEACGVVIRLEYGRTIYHAGDTCLFDDMDIIARQYGPEVALLPIGDRFTMGPSAAVKAAALIKPKFAIPIHYGTFPLLTGTAEEFAQKLAAFPTKPVVLAPGEEFEF